MSIALSICAGLALFTAVVHAWPGGRQVLRPALAADMNDIVRDVMEVAWHLLTWHFVLLGGLFGYGAIAGGQVGLLAAAVGGAHAFGFAAIFLVVSLRQSGSVFRLPQWILFLPIGALSLAAPFLNNGARVPSGGDAAAAVAVVVLVLLAVLHVAWAFGSTWPVRNLPELARLVVGVEANGGMPGRGATIVVAVGLFGAAAWVFAVRGAVPCLSELALKVGAWGLVGVFALRGIGGFFEPVLRPQIRAFPYAKWNARLYSPIAVTLALCIGIATART